MPSKLIVVGGPILVVVLMGVAGYAYSQIRYLSLPIPQFLALLTVLLPLFTGISTALLPRLLSVLPSVSSGALASNTPKSAAFSPPRLGSLVVVLAVQLIYETAVATLAMTYLVPSPGRDCALNERWGRLFSAKNARAIRAVQDNFHCCGMNSVKDRAWPFKSADNDVDACVRLHGFQQACREPWKQAEELSAGLLLLVAVIVFLTKTAGLVWALWRPANRQPWTAAVKALTANAHSTVIARRFTEEGTDCETGNEHYEDVMPALDAPYRDDESEVGRETMERTDRDNRPRLEPSGLGDGGQEWRDEGGR